MREKPNNLIAKIENLRIKLKLHEKLRTKFDFSEKHINFQQLLQNETCSF